MGFSCRCLVAVAALMAGFLLLVACGGDDEGEEELDLDQYFQRLEEIDRATAVRWATLIEESAGSFATDIEVARKWFRESAAIAGRVLDEVRGLHPPAEVREAHDEFVAAQTEALKTIEATSDRVALLESPSEVIPIVAELNEPPLNAVFARVGDACLDLVRVAEDNDIEFEMECGQNLEVIQEFEEATFELSFVRSCVAEGADEAYCRCVFSHIEGVWGIDTFTREAESFAFTGQSSALLQEMLTSAYDACKD